jgi:hypothetical protein
MKRGLLVALVACGAQFAHASFELVMVADRGTKSVHRFDGTTGAYLGAFGKGYVQNPLALEINTATNTAYVLDTVDGGTGTTASGVRLWAFNYNTGEYLASARTQFNYNFPFLTRNELNGRLFVGNDGGLTDAYDQFSLSYIGASSRAFASYSSLRGGGDFDSAGNLWVGDGLNLRRISATNVGTSFGFTSLLCASGAPVNQVAVSGSRLLCAGAVSYSAIQNITTLAATGNNPGVQTDTTYNQINGVGFGHGDIAYVTGVASGGGAGKISRILFSEKLKLQDFGTGILVEPRSMAVVVAPEPGTMIAIGTGLAVLARRRKKS